MEKLLEFIEYFEGSYRVSMDSITDIDRKLIRLLQEDCRVSNHDLAARAGLSTSACWRRVRALEEAGVISRCVALVDPEITGLGFRAMVHVSLVRTDRKYVNEFISCVKLRPEVLQCFATAGTPDYHLLVMCEDLNAYNRFYDEFLFKLASIGNVTTNLILQTIKSEIKLPL